MATKQAVRDTGIVALVPADIPRPTGKGRNAGMALRPGSIAIHAGETEQDALAFATALRASYARYLEARPALLATGHDMTVATTNAKTGKRSALAPIPRTPDVASSIPRSSLSDGLTPHKCDATAGKVRIKYLVQPAAVSRTYCVACEPDREPMRGVPVKCGECDATSYHGRYSYSGAEAHEYRPVPVVSPEAVTPLEYLDVPRIIPADLCEPYGRNVPRSGTAPRVVPAPEPPKPRATRKPPAPKPEPERCWYYHRTAGKPPERCTLPDGHDPADHAKGGGHLYPSMLEPVRETKAAPRIVVPIVQEPARKPQRGYRPEPCPRCGRADFSTDKGRAWHIENNASCAQYVRPDRHAYVALAS